MIRFDVAVGADGRFWIVRHDPELMAGPFPTREEADAAVRRMQAEWERAHANRSAH